MLKHRWDITPKEAIALQRRLACRVRATPLRKKIRTVAGTDCAFLDGGRRIIAAAVLLDAATMEVLAIRHVVMECRFPYVPGLMSFREAPAIIAAVKELPVRPDLLMLDGQGLAHPRGLGIACHAGLWLDMPAIGVAKSRLCGEHRAPARRRGAIAPLLLDGRRVGAVVRTRTGVKPLYVSVGHRVSLSQATAWVIRCATSTRLPQPTRLAHQAVSRLKLSPDLS